jgi:hypothetical protein
MYDYIFIISKYLVCMITIHTSACINIKSIGAFHFMCAHDASHLCVCTDASHLCVCTNASHLCVCIGASHLLHVNS